jgi:hypothetical protein
MPGSKLDIDPKTYKDGDLFKFLMKRDRQNGYMELEP